MCISPRSVVSGDKTLTSITVPEPKAPTPDPDFSGSAEGILQQEQSDNDSSDQPMLLDHSSTTSDFPAVLPSMMQPLSGHITTDQPEGRSPPEAASALPHNPGADASDVDAVVNCESSAATFWARCNEAGCTEEIFSDLVSQLNSMGERIQSQEATQQGERSLYRNLINDVVIQLLNCSTDFDVALKVLEASERLPMIITQLEQGITFITFFTVTGISPLFILH